MFDIPIFAQGFALGIGVFICPGPKDVVILREALLRRPAVGLVAIAVLSDALLIWLGVAGISNVLTQFPGTQKAALWLGVLLMLGHGLLAARRVIVGDIEVPVITANDQSNSGNGGLTAVAVASFLNPVAWLDTVLIVGMTCAALPQADRLSFSAGAVTASLIWFVTLVVGGRYAGRWMSSPRTWQALEVFVVVAMAGFASYLASTLV